LVEKVERRELMRGSKRMALWGLCIIFIFFSVGTIFAADFSADMVAKTKDWAFKGKFFVSGDKSRMESREGITITRIDKKLVWVLMPDQKMYMQTPLGPDSLAGQTEKMPGEVERKLIGTETIEGKLTDKYRIVANTDKQKSVILLWLIKGLNIPAKTAAEDGSWVFEYKNIKTGAQPASLFEVPADYQLFNMPSLGN